MFEHHRGLLVSKSAAGAASQVSLAGGKSFRLTQLLLRQARE